MDSWNELCIDRLHAQLIYSFGEWTLITDSKIRGFERIQPQMRLHFSYFCACVHEKHTFQVLIRTVRPPKHPKEPTSLPVEYV